MKNIIFVLFLFLISCNGCNKNNDEYYLIKMTGAECMDGYYYTSHINKYECWYEKLQDKNNNFIKCGEKK